VLVSKVVEAMEGDKRWGGGGGGPRLQERIGFELGAYEVGLGDDWFASRRVGNHVKRRHHAWATLGRPISSSGNIRGDIRCALEFLEAHQIDSNQYTGHFRPIPVRFSACLSIEETGSIGRWA